MNNIITAAVGTAAVLTGTQMLVLGAKGGIGPFGFIHRNKIAKHPGNGENYKFETIQPLENSPLEGKNVCVLGSSVVQGAGSLDCAVPEYMERRFCCKITKEAVSGTTLCDISGKSYVSRLKRIDTAKHFDLFICQLSTNDARRKMPIGQIGTLDCSTVTGSMEYIIQYVTDKWNCPVVFFTGSRYDSKAYEKMVKQLMQLKNKYGIGVLNLWDNETLSAVSKDDYKLYMIDSIHPTKAGYRDWWGPEIEKQLIEYLKNKIRERQ